jgi:hypothetical protein
LFQDTVQPDAAGRLSQKFSTLPLSPAYVAKRLDRLQTASSVHIREIERILDSQVDSAVAANLRVAGGAAMIWDSVMHLLIDRLAFRESLS